MSFDILNDSEVRCGGSRVGQKLFCRRVFPVQVSQMVNLIVERLFFFIVDLTNTDQPAALAFWQAHFSWFVLIEPGKTAKEYHWKQSLYFRNY